MDGEDAKTLFRELLNLYQLHEQVDKIVLRAAERGSFSLSEAIIKGLHSIAMGGMLENAGAYRTSEVHITNCDHVPPAWIDVEVHMVNLCRYVNENWGKKDLVHLAAFVLWRLNWIHPFSNGNGRTARAVSYLVLCAKHGALLPGKNSMIEQIVRDRQPYYKALNQADKAYAAGSNIDEALKPLEYLLTMQLKEQIQANLQEG